MDDSGSLAAPPSERNRICDVIDYPVLQVNHPRCACREENSRKRKRGCGMWVVVLHKAEVRLRRIHLQGTRVNKGKKKGRSFYAPALRARSLRLP
jgi:hypothetical protein